MNIEDIENLEYEKTNWEDWPSKKTKVTAQLLMKIENIIEKLCKVVSGHIKHIKEYGEKLAELEGKMDTVEKAISEYGDDFKQGSIYAALFSADSGISLSNLQSSFWYVKVGNICHFRAEYITTKEVPNRQDDQRIKQDLKVYMPFNTCNEQRLAAMGKVTVKWGSYSNTYDVTAINGDKYIILPVGVEIGVHSMPVDTVINVEGWYITE